MVSIPYFGYHFAPYPRIGMELPISPFILHPGNTIIMRILYSFSTNLTLAYILIGLISFFYSREEMAMTLVIFCLVKQASNIFNLLICPTCPLPDELQMQEYQCPRVEQMKVIIRIWRFQSNLHKQTFLPGMSNTSKWCKRLNWF